MPKATLRNWILLDPALLMLTTITLLLLAISKPNGLPTSFKSKQKFMKQRGSTLLSNSLVISYINESPILSRKDKKKVIINEVHRQLAIGNPIYLEEEKKSRQQQREFFKKGLLHQQECLPDLWDSDPEGPPDTWEASSKRKQSKDTLSRRSQNPKMPQYSHSSKVPCSSANGG